MNISTGRYDQNERGYCQFTSFLSMLNQALIKKLKIEYDINCSYQISMNDLIKCIKDKLLLNPNEYKKNCSLWSVTRAERVGSGTIYSNGRPSPYKDYRNLEKIIEFYICEDSPSISSTPYSDVLQAFVAREDLSYQILAKTLIENNGGGGPAGLAKSPIIWDASSVAVSSMGPTISIPDNFPFRDDKYINYDFDFLRESILIIKKEKTEQIPVINTIANEDLSSIDLLFNGDLDYFFKDPSIANILIDTILSSTIEVNLIDVPEGSREVLNQEQFSPDSSQELSSGGFCCVNNIPSNVYFGRQDCINAGGSWIDGYYEFDINEPGVCEKTKPSLCSYDYQCNYVKFKANRKEINLDELLPEPFAEDYKTPNNEDYINYFREILINNSSIDIGVSGWLINWLAATNNPNINIINDEWFIDYENAIASLPKDTIVPELFSAHAIQLTGIEISGDNYIFAIKNSWPPPLDYITITINKKYLDINHTTNEDMKNRLKIFKSIYPMNFPIYTYESYIDISNIEIVDKSDIVCFECASTSSSSSYF